MRPSYWILLLSVLVFGIGWNARSLADSNEPLEQRSGSGGRGPRGDHHRGGRGGGRRGPSSGPFLHSIESFSDRLALDDDQQQELDNLISETRTRVREYEGQIWEVFREINSRAKDLLTDSQRELLNQLVDEERKAERAARIAQRVAAISESAELSDESARAVETILTEYEEARSSAFRDCFDGDGELPGREELTARLEEVREQRDSQLLDYVDESVVSQLTSSDFRRGRGSRGRR